MKLLKNTFPALLAAIALFSANLAYAGGNELAYHKVQELDTIAAGSVDTAADYIPVYDASAGKVKKVLASSTVLPGGVTATVSELNYSDLSGSVGTVQASKVMTVDASKDITGVRNWTQTGTFTGGSGTDIAINTNKFTVAGSSGNTAVGGTLTLGSGSDIAVNTNKFTVAASSGNTLVAGTLNVTGTSTVAAVTASGAVTSTTDKTDYSKFLGPETVFAKSGGTWTITRIAQADYGLVHSTADDTAILAIDITPSLRTAASKGNKLTTIDVAYKNITGAMDAHTATLDKVCYANNVANAVTSVPISGSLATATQVQPYLSTLTVTTPAFLNTADCNYILEITANNSASSVYTFFGVNLNFTRNDL